MVARPLLAGGPGGPVLLGGGLKGRYAACLCGGVRVARPVLLAGGSSGPVLPGGGLKGRYLSRCASSVEVAPRGRYSMAVCGVAEVAPRGRYSSGVAVVVLMEVVVVWVGVVVVDAL